MKRVVEVLREFAGFAGCGSIVYGTAMIYEPAAWVVAGIALLALAVFMGRNR